MIAFLTVCHHEFCPNTAGMMSLKRCAWQVKSLCILNLNVPKADAVAWLESLPDNDTFVAISVTMKAEDGLFDLGAMYNGVYHTCWIALAHEMVGLHEGALRFADLQLEPDMAKAGRHGARCFGRIFHSKMLLDPTIASVFDAAYMCPNK